jgi:hypothetical protein
MNLTDEPVAVRETGNGISFTVHVQPRASRCGLAGIRDGAVRVRLTSPPVDGAANEQCLDVLARALDVRRKDIAIIAGTTSRHKTIRIEGITAEQFRLTLASYHT